MEIEAPGSSAISGVLGSVAKEVAKGALGAVGGKAMTGLLGLMGLDSSGSAQAEMGAELKQINAQLAALGQAVEGLHRDLSGIHQDLLQLDRHLVDQARAARLQTVSLEIEKAETTIQPLYEELLSIPLLAARDRAARARQLVAEILRDHQIERALDTLHGNLVGVEGMEQVDGTEGALELLLHAVSAHIAEARSRQESVAGYAVRSFEASVAPYFLGRAGTQLQGALLLMNAHLADPDLLEQESRNVLARKVAEDFVDNLARQCAVFAEITRHLAVENWVSEFLYAGAMGTPAYDSRHLQRNLLPQSDALVDDLLGRNREVVLRVFVSHCHTDATVEPGSEADQQATTRLTEALRSALPEAVAEAAWWTAGRTPPDPTAVPASTWPPFSGKLLMMIYQPTAQLLELRLPSDGVRAGTSDLLASMLPAVLTKLDPTLRVRADGVALFPPGLEAIRFPSDVEGHPRGSLNIATYWPGSFATTVVD